MSSHSVAFKSIFDLIQDRKLLIRSLKSFVVKIAKEEQGYPVLWTIFDIVDDTKLVSKIVLQVIKPLKPFEFEYLSPRN